MKIMVSLLFTCVFISHTFPTHAQKLQDQVQALMNKGEIPGLSVAYISKNKLAWYKVFGVGNAQTKTPVNNNSVFEAASLSKPLFAYAVMKLVEEGKIDLNKPLSEYLASPYPDVYDPRISKITARHVLSHTTGFPNWRNGDTLKIFFEPGDRFSYSGEGFVFLSKVVESITGEKFNDFMTRTVFVPLDMKHSSYAWRKDYDTDKVFAHNTRGEPTFEKINEDYYNAAASLHTTAEDYAKFVLAILQSKGISKRTRDMMLTPVVQTHAKGTQTIRRPDAPLFPGVFWGLGWGIQEVNGSQSFFHWGDNGDVKAFIVGRVKEQDAIVYFANSAYGLSIASELVSDALKINVPATAWLREEKYNAPPRRLFRNIIAQGATTVMRQYVEWRKTQPADSLINEDRMNEIGLDLLRMGKTDDAIVVLTQNVSDYPQSFNVFDSLGEAYAAKGDKEQAIKNYEISVQMNPKNQGGIDALKKLKQ